MYNLMQKDNVVATFIIKDSVARVVRLNTRLPFGCTEQNLTGWIERRYVAKRRKQIGDYLRRHNADSLEGFIALAHCASINDTYWVKDLGDDLAWKDVSLYTNDFDDIIMKSAPTPSIRNHVVSPEFATDGQFAKFWRKHDNGIYLYKAGREGSDREPINEYLASQVYVKMHAGIGYGLTNNYKYITSICKLFNNEDMSYVPYKEIGYGADDWKSIITFYADNNCLDGFRRILVCDAIVFNTDRHTRNHGMMYNSDTMKFVKMAPGFDYNLALFPDEKLDSFDINSVPAVYRPWGGYDFVQVAKKCLTPAIRKDLSELYGFSYEERGNPQRTQWLTELSNAQIKRILE